MDALAMDAFAMDAHHFHECAVVATGHPSGEAAAATGSACPRFFLEKLGVDAVACAVSWLNLFVC